MSTVAYIGRGCHLQAFISSAYVSIAQLQKFSMSGIKVVFDDVTNIDSASSYKEVMPVLLDPGEITLEGILNPEDATQTDLLTQLVGLTSTQFKIILSNANATTVTFTGFVAEYAPVNVETTKAITFSAKLQISGPVTIGS
jgi:hypothetical protein